MISLMGDALIVGAVVVVEPFVLLDCRQNLRIGNDGLRFEIGFALCALVLEVRIFRELQRWIVREPTLTVRTDRLFQLCNLLSCFEFGSDVSDSMRGCTDLLPYL